MKSVDWFKRQIWKTFAGRLVFGLLLGGFIAPAMAVEDHALPHSENLASLGESAQAGGIPVLLMFSSLHCDYCRRLESEVLAPMARWETDPRQVIIGKVEVGAGELLRDFNGQAVTADALADAYEVDVFPTLVLVNPQGESLVPNIVGYQSPDFYSAYLDAAIAAGQQLLARESTSAK